MHIYAQCGDEPTFACAWAFIDQSTAAANICFARLFPFCLQVVQSSRLIIIEDLLLAAMLSDIAGEEYAGSLASRVTGSKRSFPRDYRDEHGPGL